MEIVHFGQGVIQGFHTHNLNYLNCFLSTSQYSPIVQSSESFRPIALSVGPVLSLIIADIQRKPAIVGPQEFDHMIFVTAV